MSAPSLPPAQPAYILRGHAAQVHVLHFTTGNVRLLSGDADGWIVSWNLASKRPVAVWKAHDSSILGIASWGNDRIITHGRDNKLIVWRSSLGDEDFMEKTLPVNAQETFMKQPWILHILTVNTLNFCSFSMCDDQRLHISSSRPKKEEANTPSSILVAVPNTLNSNGIDIFNLPSEARISGIPAEKPPNLPASARDGIPTGMVMAVKLLFHDSHLQVIAGYESGHTIVFVWNELPDAWQILYSGRPHSQPVLSLVTCPNMVRREYLTSSADAIIAKHPLPSYQDRKHSSISLNHTAEIPSQILHTRHSGQQSLSMRSDGKIFATAGWDSRVRIYNTKSMKEIACLKWHKGGVYATAFAEIPHYHSPKKANGVAQLHENSIFQPTAVDRGGTDSPKSVLDGPESYRKACLTTTPEPKLQPKGTPVRIVHLDDRESSTALVPDRSNFAKCSAMSNIQYRRENKALSTHWLAAGSKDGKVSLWDIY